MQWILGILAAMLGFLNKNLVSPLSGYVSEPIKIVEQEVASQPALPATVTIRPAEPTATKIPEPTKKPLSTAANIGDTAPWGVAKQVGEHTYVMKVGEDGRMATPGEILKALNDYRVVHGSQQLTWDSNLANFAQSRADHLFSIKNVDGHKGFEDYLQNEDGFDKLGFTWLGENISYGYQMEGVHLIEWLYGGDKEHDENQLNNRWNYVGVGVKGTATAIIFGTGKR